MSALDDKCELEETASQKVDRERWLAVSKPLAIDEDPEWEDAVADPWIYERVA